MSFKRLKIWRGRLPHWRAEGVRYYVTFRHRRPLTYHERRILFGQLNRLSKEWQINVFYVGENSSSMVFEPLPDSPAEMNQEFSDRLEKLKLKAGRQIIKSTGEKWTPFYGESYDHIIRDEEDLLNILDEIEESATDGVPDEDESEFLFQAEAAEWKE
ncbi:MAG: hypothetical protein ACK4P3_06335 [Fimbriimonadaceae bacterium]